MRPVPPPPPPLPQPSPLTQPHSLSLTLIVPRQTRRFVLQFIFSFTLPTLECSLYALLQHMSWLRHTSAIVRLIVLRKARRPKRLLAEIACPVLMGAMSTWVTAGGSGCGP